MKEYRGGFTLLEMLIAIAVFALISLSGQQIVQTVYRTDEISSGYSQSLREIQFAMHLISYDVVQMVPRPLRGGDGSWEPALLAGANVLNSEYEGLRFVRGGLPNPQMLLPRSHFSRVGYRISQGNLQRLTWPVVDAPSNIEPVVQIILKEVKALEFHFFDGKKWLKNWDFKTEVPSAIKMKTSTNAMGDIERIWLLKGPQMNTGNM